MIFISLFTLIFSAHAQKGVQKQPNIHYENGKEIIDTEITYYITEGKRHGYTLKVNSKGELVHLGDCEVHGERAPLEDCKNILIPGYEKLQQKHFQAEVDDKKKQDNQFVKSASSEYQLKDGKIEGERKDFYPSGKLKIVSNFKGGKQQGLETHYFEEGQIKLKTEYKNDIPQNQTGYFQNGKIKFQWEIKDTSGFAPIISVKTYNDKEKLIEEGNLKISTLHSRKIEYVPSGNRIGKWVSYSDKTWTEIQYDSKGFRISETDFDTQTKNKIEHREYMPDDSIKSSK